MQSRVTPENANYTKIVLERGDSLFKLLYTNKRLMVWMSPEVAPLRAVVTAAVTGSSHPNLNYPC
jgi:hypothetical protein